MKARRRAVLALAWLLAGCGAPAHGDAVPSADVERSPPAERAPSDDAPALTIESVSWPEPLPPSDGEAPFLNAGLLAGSWSLKPGPEAFREEWIDEAALLVVDTRLPAGRRKWRGFTNSSPVVPLDALVNDREDPVAAYVFSVLTLSPDAEWTPVVLHLRHRGRLRARLDGRLLVDSPAPAGGGWAEARVPAVVRGPHAGLLLKLARGGPDFGLSMEVEVRATAPDGSPLPGQRWKPIRVHGP